MTRRAFLQGIVASSVLMACGDDGPPTRPSGSLAPRPSRPSTKPAAGIPEPKGYLISRWRQDRFARGSYSYLPVDVTPDVRSALATPVGDRLFFAGEATSSEYPATVHGAYLSGRRAAEEVEAVAKAHETVLVLGAGVAGLAAGRYLADEGYDVVVIEGRDRIGGRIATDRTLGVALEMGAAWIHGADGNPIRAIADELGVDRRPTDYDNVYLYEAPANLVPDDEFPDWRRLIDLGDARVDLSVADLVRDRIGDVDSRSRRRLEYAITAGVEHDFAASLDELGSLALDEGEEFGGDDDLIVGGYDAISDRLGRDLDVRLNHAVDAVTYDDAGVAVSTSAGELRGDRLVVTLPLGVLKAGDVEFTPPLPAHKVDAVRRLGMGLLNKVGLAFDDVFWDGDADVIGYVSQETGQWAEWYNLMPVVGAPLLVGYNAAAVADSFEALSDEKLVASAMRTLRTIYG